MLLLMIVCLIFYELFFLLSSILSILFLYISSIQYGLVDLMLLLVGDSRCRVTRLMLPMRRLRPFVGLQHQVVYYFLLKAVRR